MNNKNNRTWVSRAVASVLMCTALFKLNTCARAAENIADEIIKPDSY